MISHLADVPFFLDELAELHAAEWKHLYADWDVEAARAEFLDQKADGSLPATLVLHEGMELVGSVSVVFGDCPARADLDPWLASVCMLFRSGAVMGTAWSWFVRRSHLLPRQKRSGCMFSRSPRKSSFSAVVLKY